MIYHSVHSTGIGEYNTINTKSDVSSESGGFLCGMIQTIYPIVVTAYEIFQYGESESAGTQHYLGVANKVSCESGWV